MMNASPTPASASFVVFHISESPRISERLT
jgi:hypothetical protein